MMGLRQAIDAKCKECIFDPISGGGNWRQQVTACTATECPLFDYRPVSRPKRAASEPKQEQPLHLREYARQKRQNQSPPVQEKEL